MINIYISNFIKKTVLYFNRIAVFVCICFISTISFAGEYHAVKEKTYNKTTETLVCSQCHTMHGTQGGQSLIYGGADEQYKGLIRAATIDQLCRTCHEANDLGMSNPTPPDIWNNTLGYTPSAGDFAHNNEIVETNRHSIGQTNLTPPGGSYNVAYFHCEECHDQHGNKNYRNLKLRPGGVGSDLIVTYVLDGDGSKTCSDGVTTEPCDVNIDTISNPLPQSNLTKFQRSNVTFRKASGDTNGVAAWCGGCHTDFHGAGGASNMGGTVSGDIDGTASSYWIRHPVRDVNINEASSNMHVDRNNWAGLSSAVRVRAVDPDGVAPTSGNADEYPFCLTCHYAHGGGNPSTDQSLDHTNLMFLDSSGRINIDPSFDANSSRIRNLCQQCHNQ